VISLSDALQQFADYHTKNNHPKYARTSIRRVAEFIQLCKDCGVDNWEQVTEQHIQNYLSQTPKDTQPGAWRQRYIAIQTFFRFCVFIGLIGKEQNPLAYTPTGEALTNKAQLSHAAFQQLLFTIPANHQGLQDKLCCLLLWSGTRLGDLSQLRVVDILSFPDPAKSLAETLVAHRGHVASNALFVTSKGQKQVIHGQKFNKRLQKYATTAGLTDPERISSGLLFQSGTYQRFSTRQEGQS
jgi:site-specific recombinase XerD